MFFFPFYCVIRIHLQNIFYYVSSCYEKSQYRYTWLLNMSPSRLNKNAIKYWSCACALRSLECNGSFSEKQIFYFKV